MREAGRVLLICIFILFFATASQAQNYTDYANEKFNFKIMYPKQWMIQKIPAREGVIVSFVGPVNKYITVSITVSKLNQPVSLKEYTDAVLFTLKSLAINTNIQQEKTVIGNEIALSITHTTSFDSPVLPPLTSQVFYIIHRGIFYQITTTASKSFFSEAKKEYFNEILKSFVFLTKSK